MNRMTKGKNQTQTLSWLRRLAVVVMLLIFAPSIVNASVLIPHRAIYDMVMHSAERGSGISSAYGTMVFSFHDGCADWSSETNVKLKISYDEGDDVTTEWAFANWEAKDGLSYQFRMRRGRNGNEIENLKGRLVRSSPSAEAVARFSEPEGKTIRLPEGTLLPSSHMIELLKAGGQGKVMFSRMVFDGASLQNPYEINAVIAKRSLVSHSPRNAYTNKIIAGSGLKAIPPRHYRLAFFPLSSSVEEPSFELGVDYRSDGIALFIRQDFGDFSLDLHLQRLELLEKPNC